MQRIRTVKPELFKHDGLFDAEQESGLPLRVAFIGLLTCCDREGRFRWKPRILKLDVLPYDDVDFEEVLNELARKGFICKYEASGEFFGLVPSFSKHQYINNKETASSLPDPKEGQICEPSHISEIDAISTRERRVNIVEPSQDSPYSKKKGFVYLALCEEAMAFKIGFAEYNPEQRIKDLNNGNPNEIRLVEVIETVKGTETHIHQGLASHKVRGEWFGINEESCEILHAWFSRETHEELVTLFDSRGKELEGKGTGKEHVPAVASTTAAKKRAEPNPLNCETWEAYSSAYFLRYEVGPMRNAKTNGQIAQLVKRLGANAPHVAAWYVSHNKSWYVQHSHSLDSLVKDAEGLYTQWATNNQVTESQARSADRLGSAGRLLDSIEFDPDERF